jgi:probable HAF family extracellular repeat protein
MKAKEKNMKFRTVTCITAMALLIALLMPVSLAAQQIITFGAPGAGTESVHVLAQESASHHVRYKLIDLGTLGGANSFVNGGPPATINNKGVIAAEADTTEPCSYFDGVVSPAVRWENGELTNLGLLPGGCFSLPNAINEMGVLVGSGDIGVIDPIAGVPEIRADLRYRGKILDLGTLGGTNSLANDVNDAAQVVGGAQHTEPDPWNFGDLLGLPSSTAWHGFVWQGGLMRDLGTLGGPDSFAYIINERGQIAGFAFKNSIANETTGIPTVDPFLWERGNMRDLGTLGGAFGYASGLNNRGQVVGFSDLEGDLTNHAFIWDRGVLTDIGTLGGDNSSAFWINDAGQVVGNADLPDGTHHGFVWSNGMMTDIGTLGGDPCSNAFYINARGQVVGTTADCHGTILHSFVWQNGTFTDLGAQVLPGSDFATIEPRGINDMGEIVGNGTLLNGDVHAVLMKPDGDCDTDCEAKTIYKQRSVTASPRQTARTITAVLEAGSSTTLERLQNSMRQRYQVPGRK